MSARRAYDTNLTTHADDCALAMRNRQLVRASAIAGLLGGAESTWSERKYGAAQEAQALAAAISRRSEAAKHPHSHRVRPWFMAAERCTHRAPPDASPDERAWLAVASYCWAWPAMPASAGIR